jgi:hypothetical protein
VAGGVHVAGQQLRQRSQAAVAGGHRFCVELAVKTTAVAAACWVVGS